MLALAGCAGFQKEQSTTISTSAIESPGSADQEDFSLKRKVAVGRFTNDTRLASSFLTEGSDMGEKLSRAAADILSAKLAKTDRFLLIERQDSLVINNEQRVSNIQSYRIPADYLILGSISEFGRSTSGNVGLVDRTKKQTAQAKVTLRIVDTRTGMVIFGEEGSGEAYSEVGTVLGMGSQAGYDDTLTDKAIDAAISAVIQNLINKLSHDPWISYPLSVEGDRLFMSGGALQGIKAGTEFKVYQRGKTVLNPQTNVPIELPGTLAARIVVTDVIPGSELTEISVARIIEGEIPADDLTNYFISDK
ncbi:MAG: CsgG/HfaB family protein [Candidatus Syntrophosphaera sp.]|nr:CsgG/HfaB family protein [Candidatus Syntrophosphaera sp.]